MTRMSGSRVGFALGVIGLAMLSPVGWPEARAAGDPQLADAIRKLVTAPGVGKMRVGVRIESLGSEPGLIYERDSTEQFKPASNQKILTTAAAMCLLPEDFTYRTVLAVRGDDLVIVGGGDPSCGDPRMAQAAEEPVTAMFHDWAHKLQTAGITQVRGELLFDDSIFDDEYILASWRKQFNLLDWYCAPVGGLNFNDNCIDVLCQRGEKNGDPAMVTLIPGTSWITLENKARTAAKGEPIVRLVGKGPITVTVSGSVSRSASPSDPLSISITDPGMFFATACRTSLAAKGIAIVGETRRSRVRSADGSLPGDAQIVGVHRRPLSEILWRVNKSSLNMFAEGVLKTLGAYTGAGDEPRVGSYATGRAAISRYLDTLGIPRESYVIDDGSGLSHNNRVTPASITTVLRHMNSHPRRQEWWSNLAVPGEKTGTLKRRMHDLAGKVYAKTGYIGGTSALSGYVLGPGGRLYAFSVLCNDTGRSKGTSPQKLQDEICRKLATWGATTAGGKPASAAQGG